VGGPSAGSWAGVPRAAAQDRVVNFRSFEYVRLPMYILGIAARNSAGKCSQSKPPLALHLVINGSGPVTMP